MMPTFTNDFFVILTTAVCLFFLFHKKIRQSSTWHATVTPLASIIGSGFLVCAPLLMLTTGRLATVVMFIIVTIAYAIGSSIRFNIRYFEPLLDTRQQRFHWAYRLEILSEPILGIAYIISVAFYLKLL